MLISIIGKAKTLTMSEFNSPLATVFSKLTVVELDASASLNVLLQILICSDWITI